MSRIHISDYIWVKVKRFFPSERGRRGRPALDNRIMVEGIIWILRTGAPWRDLPDCYPKWQSVYTRFSRWAKQDFWHQMMQVLSQEKDYESIMIDGSVIRAHQHAAGARKHPGENTDQALGRSRGGFSTKIHAVVDGLGYPLNLAITPGQTHDSIPASDLISGFDCDYVLADKAYDTNSFLNAVESLAAIAVIPPKKNRTVQRDYDKHIYKERHLVEIFFNRIKQYRRIATRYEKTARNYMAMLHIACCLLWARI